MKPFALLPLLALAAANPIEKRFTSGAKLRQGDQCLDPGSDVYAKEGYVHSGQSVTNPKCENTSLTWDINWTEGTITLHDNPDLSLDAGEFAGRYSLLKLVTSSPGLKQQTWEWDKSQIKLNGTNLCIDNRYSVMLLDCQKGSDSQIWVIDPVENPLP